MYELLAELLPTVAYAAAALLATGIGVLAERGGLAHLANGDGVLGVWMIGVGALLLYVGIVVFGYEKFLGRLATSAGSD